MEYRGIITAGYYNDLGGQNFIRILSGGYIGELTALAEIFNIVQEVAYFQILKISYSLFSKTRSEESRHAKTSNRGVKF